MRFIALSRWTRPLFLFGLFLVAMLVFGGGSASATPSNEADIKAIQGTAAGNVGTFLNVKTISIDIGGTEYIFLDRDQYDSTYEYRIVNSECDGRITFNEHPGLNRGSGSLSGEIDIDYAPPNGSCSGTDPNEAVVSLSRGFHNVWAEYNDADTIRFLPESDNVGLPYTFTGESSNAGDLWVKDDGNCSNLLIVQPGGKSYKLYVMEGNKDNGEDGLDQVPEPERSLLEPYFPDNCEIQSTVPDPGSDTTDKSGGVRTAFVYPLGNTVVIDPTDTSGAPASSTNVGSPIDVGEADSCNSEGGEFSFILCPLLRIANDAIVVFDERIQSGLNISNDYYEAPEIRAIWARIRNISYILLIPIVLIIVIATALNFQFVDAYTVKRAMPRLLAAVIFMALSLDIGIIMIEITNAVGAGVAGIVAAPFGGTSNLQLTDIFEASGEGDLTALFVGGPLAALAAITALSAGILGSYLLVAALALVIIFALIAVRELIIIFLLILGPLAILSWIFPGNDKVWKLWWGSFTKLLMVYPLIIGLLWAGRGFAKLVQEIEDGGSFFTIMIKLTVYIAPFFFIFYAFKFAGGVFGNLAGAVNDRGKGIFDRQKKYRAEKRKDQWERTKAGKRFENKGDSAFVKRLNKKLAYGSNLNKAGFKGIYDKETRRGRIMADIDTHEKLAFEAVLEDKAANTLMNNEDNGQAAIHGGGTVEGMIEYYMSEFAVDKDGNYLDEAGNIVDSKEKAARKFAYDRKDATRLANGMRGVIDEHGIQAVQMASIVKAAGSKTGYKGGAGEMMNAIAQVSEGNIDFASHIYAKARGAAEQGGRMDLAGYSFGEGLAYLQQIAQVRNNGPELQEAMSRATADLTDRVVDSKGAGQLLTSHGTSVKNIADSMQRRVVRANNAFIQAQESGDPNLVVEAQRDLMFALAETANAYDVASYASPENGREFAEAVLDQKITFRDEQGGPNQIVTVQQLMNDVRNDTEFQQRRREIGRTPEELELARQRGSVGGADGTFGGFGGTGGG